MQSVPKEKRLVRTPIAPRSRPCWIYWEGAGRIPAYWKKSQQDLAGSESKPQGLPEEAGSHFKMATQ